MQKQGVQEARTLQLVALLGATEAEVPVLAEVHRNTAVHVVGLWDSDPDVVGHDLAEILGLRHGHDQALLDQLASAEWVVLPRDRNRLGPAIEYLRERGCHFLTLDQALERFAPERIHEHPMPPQLAPDPERELRHLEQSLLWLQRSLDGEELLRALLSIAVQAASADHGSIQLLDENSQELYIAYADGLSDHTIRNARQKIGEGIAGGVARDLRARLLQGGGEDTRDRPDIQSAICVPLMRGEELRGVLNVSTDLGSRRLEKIDLERVIQLSLRLGPALDRLLEVQTLRDSILVEELERELDHLLQMDLGIESSLALARDLLKDISGAHRGELIVLAPDGPALHILEGYDEEGNPKLARDVDPSRGIIAQVLLSGAPVVMEEKLRDAGSEHTRRVNRLYLPLGSPESFALVILGFEGMAALRDFQRSVDRILRGITPRLGDLLARSESEGRMQRLQKLARGLSQLASLDLVDRAGMAATLFMQYSSAMAVGLWIGEQAEPDIVLQASGLQEELDDRLWPKLVERLKAKGSRRLREMDLQGAHLRSLMVVGGEGGRPALAAMNRVAEGPMEELGFREEDLDAASMLIDALSDGAQELSMTDENLLGIGPSTPTPLSNEEEYRTGARLLLEALERELLRAQRYHSAFSITCFQVGQEGEEWDGPVEAFRDVVEKATRSTDCILWIGPVRFAILAPEEARGQRLLARRFQGLLLPFLQEVAGGQSSAPLLTGSASYPQDADNAGELLRSCLGQMRPSDN